MKTLGIVGGLGPESTIDYYRSIISVYRQMTGNAGYPHMVIVSLDVDEGLRMLGAGELQKLADYQLGAIRQLAAAGADFALVSANSGHIVFDEMQRISPLPLISIVEVTCDEVRRQGLRTVGLMGTRFTMSGHFYPQTFEKHGIRLATPTPEEQAWIHDKYVNELLRGTFLPETREGLTQIVTTMKQRDAIEGIVLAGTELPLILRAESIAGLPLFDTTQIHVKAAVTEIMRDEGQPRV
jgi:aspartate racemase